MRIKVDEDLPRAVAEVLRAAGHEVATVPEQGWTGWADARIWSAVSKEGRLLITADKGLADIRLVKQGTSPSGVVLLRLDPESWQGYRALAKRLLMSMDLEMLRGAVAVVTDNGIRVRRPFRA